MRDGFLIQTLPFFTGALAFLSGCESKSPAVDPTATDGTTEPGTSSSGSATGSTSADTSGTSDPTTSTTETSPTTTVDTTETGDPACGGGTCGAPVEDGWFGPTVIARLPTDAELPSCTPEYPSAGPTLLDGFADPGPAICDCTCELEMAPNCNVSVTSFNSQNCGSFANSTAVSANCSNLTIQASARAYSFGGYGVGSCEETELEEIPPVPWNATIRTCRVPENALACGDGGICLPDQPAGFEDTWCMYKQGDHECPAGPYSNKSRFWSGADDTRECSNCTCGTEGTSCNDAEVLVFAGADCEGEPVGSIAPNTCSNITGNSVAGSIGAESPCPVTAMPEPMGAVVAQGDFTFCCTG